MENGDRRVRPLPTGTPLANFWVLLATIVGGGLLWEALVPGAGGYIRGTVCYAGGCLVTARFFGRNAGSEKAESLERWVRVVLVSLAVPAVSAGLVVLAGRRGLF